MFQWLENKPFLRCPNNVVIEGFNYFRFVTFRNNIFI